MLCCLWQSKEDRWCYKTKTKHREAKIFSGVE